jgi:hypothetical protein
VSVKRTTTRTGEVVLDERVVLERGSYYRERRFVAESFEEYLDLHTDAAPFYQVKIRGHLLTPKGNLHASQTGDRAFTSLDDVPEPLRPLLWGPARLAAWPGDAS